MMSNKLRIFTLFSAICIILFVIQGYSNENEPLTDAEKVKLKKAFVTDPYIMPDTLIHYKLYQDSLVFTFRPKAHYKLWTMHTILRTNDSSPGRDLGDKTGVKVIGNSIVWTGFHIPADSTDLYSPELFAFPIMEGNYLVVRNPADNNCMFFKDKNKNGILLPWGPGKKQNYIGFELSMLPKLKKREYDYCWELLGQLAGLHFPKSE